MVAHLFILWHGLNLICINFSFILKKGRSSTTNDNLFADSFFLVFSEIEYIIILEACHHLVFESLILWMRCVFWSYVRVLCDWSNLYGSDITDVLRCKYKGNHWWIVLSLTCNVYMRNIGGAWTVFMCSEFAFYCIRVEWGLYDCGKLA
jgi:hypothetical protein